MDRIPSRSDVASESEALQRGSRCRIAVAGARLKPAPVFRVAARQWLAQASGSAESPQIVICITFYFVSYLSYPIKKQAVSSEIVKQLS
ncbi:hypothetical protein ACI2IY_23175 [Lysobacter enzymogenes]|uniref:hypothetical protein n=1 Tax=Lysobacter enzymogenes TaxID=69 RepID=UPI00384AEB16